MLLERPKWKRDSEKAQERPAVCRLLGWLSLLKLAAKWDPRKWNRLALRLFHLLCEDLIMILHLHNLMSCPCLALTPSSFAFWFDYRRELIKRNFLSASQASQDTGWLLQSLLQHQRPQRSTTEWQIWSQGSLLACAKYSHSNDKNTGGPVLTLIKRSQRLSQCSVAETKSKSLIRCGVTLSGERVRENYWWDSWKMATA